MSPDDRALARIEALRGFLAKDPTDAFSGYALAMELAKSPSTEAEALVIFDGLLRNAPEYLPAYYQHARVLARSDNLAAARDVAQKGAAEAQRQGDLHTRDELRALLETF